ncbi:ABC transporter ATP-binding protein [Chitinibacter fontanus]|uniref:ABC transporter ATP-binding protein n=1 Tax=Chitinibacter fontanus TaxID=1737446 RepID=A0A7D5ZGB8_9NEIS|nr:ABC transporter ATP-binding protein [Chitinibacter fontanus]QLI81307.1 ABC transporter ATP-binding protein [Chitinibacter fontanus]
MSELVAIHDLSVSYGAKQAVKPMSFQLERGRIIGLLGSNGAGKTSLMQAMMGLIPFKGTINILGFDPRTQREAMLEHVCYIPDVAILPPWIEVQQLLQLMCGLHPKFNRELALQKLARTTIKLESKVKQLSRGMIVQLHLAIISAIDAKLMILDEPTLGLDIPARKAFYDMLVSDWCNEERTVLIATHQIDEIENLLSDVMMIKDGELVLHDQLDALEDRYIGLRYSSEHSAAVAAAAQLHCFRQMGGECAIFAAPFPPELEQFGQTFRVELADLFVALSQGERHATV